MRRIILLDVVLLFVLIFARPCNGSLRRRRRRSPPPIPPCQPRDCIVSQWSSWSSCSHQCGSSPGSKSRTRYIIRNAECGGRCLYNFRQENQCFIGRCVHGKALPGYCQCRLGYKGTCCESDINECTTQRPCQHKCTNTYGSYTCQCNPCYTKLGTRCDLRQCIIGGRCYSYGTVNPSNPCQICSSANKFAWSHYGAPRCSDGVACTRNDRCVNQRCVGTPFTCLSCERCESDTCKVNPGYCRILVNGKQTCFTNKNLRPGYQCQECDSNNKYRWTINNNLPCSDFNVKTKDDRCFNGTCLKGVPYSCLPCERHDGFGCPLNPGYCVIQHNGQRSCFAKHQFMPGNPCQWCEPAVSTSSFTSRDGTPCDDGNKCTAADTCNRGHCISTPLICNAQCQFCNSDSCGNKPGFGFVSGSCTCKISGKDYFHQQVNPDNECQWCDIYDDVTKATGSWTIRPSSPCNDSNPCTMNDRCQKGRCIGKTYTCLTNRTQGCVMKSVCLGDGRCRDVVKPAGVICRSPVDNCDRPERCDGLYASCNPAITDAISITSGSVTLMDKTFESPVHYQYDEDALYLRLDRFSASCGNIRYRWYLLDAGSQCGTTASIHGEFLPSQESMHVVKGLNLTDSKSYKLAIQVIDARNNARTVTCSKPVAIDTTEPQGGWVRDGSVDEIDFQTSKLITANWGGFISRHGIQKYEWRVMYMPFRGSASTELLLYSDLGLKTRASKMFYGITDGGRVNVQVRAYSKAGLFTERLSDGVVIDSSPPIPGAIYDGANKGLDTQYAKWTDTFTANWDPYRDIHSGMKSYEWTLKRVGAGLVTSYSKTELSRNGTIKGLNLISGQRYCAVVRGYNNAGLFTEAESNCVLIDHDPPRAGIVNDGRGNDVQHQSNGTAISANWGGFTDGNGSGIAGYEYQITDGKSVVIIDWTSVGNDTRMMRTGLRLKNGETYFVSVRALDGAGWVTNVKSNGVTIDTTRPVFTGEVKVEGLEGVLHDSKTIFVRSLTTLEVSWIGFTDGLSGLSYYKWAILLASQQAKDSDFKRVSAFGLPISASFSNLTLLEGKPYRVIIRAVNRAFLYTDASSLPIVPDPSPPIPGIVSDGAAINMDAAYQTSLSSISATWTHFKEAHTQIKQYYFAIGSCNHGNYHVTGNIFIPVNPPTATFIHLQGLRLVNGQRYCTKVKATNMAGVYSNETTSNGFIVDVSPPAINYARVVDGNGGNDIDFQDSNFSMSANWEGIQDTESGIRNFEFGIGTTRGGHPDVFPLKNVGFDTSVNVTGLSLKDGVYYSIVCAINNAGLRKCLASDGVIIDHTRPHRGIVNDGIIEPDLKYQSSVTQMSANWHGIWDLESGIEMFEWAVTENSANGTVIMSYTDVGLATHVTNDKHLMLQAGITYYVHLRITNNAGGMRELVSNGVTIDTTAPEPSQIIPGTVYSGDWIYKSVHNTYYSSKSSHLSAHWDAFKEDESGVWFYKWGIGISKCGTQVQPLVNIGRMTSAFAAEFTPKYGVKYYVTVTSRNRVNLVGRSCSEAFVFDNSPPKYGKVNVGHIDRHETFVRGDVVRVYWMNFKDDETGIDKCEVFINNTSESTKVLIVNDPETGSGNFSLPKTRFNSSSHHRVGVMCFNRANLSAFAWSAVFVVDTSPPVPHGRINVSSSISQDHVMQYQARTDSISATWSSFTDDESLLLSYWVALGSSPLTDDVIRYRNIGLVTSYAMRDMSLSHNTSYFVTVLGVNAAGLNSSLSSDLPLLIDTTPPLADAFSVKDGNGTKDLEFMSVNDYIKGQWRSVTDPESGIMKSATCIGTTKYGCQIKGPTNSAGCVGCFVCTTCKVNPGEKIFVTVTVFNRAGLSITRASNGVLVDGTPPLIGQVIDGSDVTDDYNDVIGNDLETALRGWKISAAYGGAEDKESGIERCDWLIVGDNGTEVFSVPLSGYFKLEKRVLTGKRTYGELILNDSMYYNVIKCRNNAKQESVTRSNGFRVVSEWPQPGVVRDGSVFGEDVEYITSTNRVAANWEQFQANIRDPVASYSWAVGTTSGKNDVMKFTNVGLTTRVEAVIFAYRPWEEPLRLGRKYYATVKATSASGLSSIRSSNGFVVDSTPPVPAKVQVTSRTLDQKQAIVELIMNWGGVYDGESGILDFSYCLGSSPGSCMTQMSLAGNSTSTSIPLFHPVSLATYFAIVKARNKALLSTVMTSEGFSFDTSPPTKGHVIDGEGKDMVFSSYTTNMAAQWGGFEDNDYGVKNCTWLLIQQSASENRSFFANDTIIFQESVSKYGRGRRGGLSLSPGSKCINRIICENKDGFQVVSNSNGVIIDISAPVVGSVSDGDNITNDLNIIANNSTVKAVWTRFTDPESGVSGYRWGLGTFLGGDDVIALHSVAHALRGEATNVTLSTGMKYFVTVEATNGVGLTSLAWSDGFVVDDTLPELANLAHVGTDWLKPEDKLSATWTSRDPESGITKTEYCVGTTLGGCQVKQMTSLPVPTATNVACHDCHIEELSTYYITVRVWNSVGLWTMGTTSAVKIDLSPPIPGAVTPQNDVITCTVNCMLTSTVTQFVDRESGINSCRFAIRDSNRFVTQFKEFQPTSNTTHASGLTLVPGQRYQTVVSCVDNAGLSTQAVSVTGVLVDVTPPSKGYVIVSPDRTHDVYRVHSSCHLYNKTIRAHWYGFNDIESGVTGFRVAMGTDLNNATNVISFTEIGIATSYELHANEADGITPGDVVYITVEARNPAGLVTKAISPPTRLVSADTPGYVREGDFSCLDF